MPMQIGLDELLSMLLARVNGLTMNSKNHQRISIGQGCSMAADQTIVNPFPLSPSNIGRHSFGQDNCLRNHLPFAVFDIGSVQSNEKVWLQSSQFRHDTKHSSSRRNTRQNPFVFQLLENCLDRIRNKTCILDPQGIIYIEKDNFYLFCLIL